MIQSQQNAEEEENPENHEPGQDQSKCLQDVPHHVAQE